MWPELSRLDTIVKASTIGAVALAATGFIIVSVYDARYGFVSGDPFRPKILAAGFTFMVCCAMSFIAAYLASKHGRHPEITGLAIVPYRVQGFLTFAITAASTANLFVPQHLKHYKLWLFPVVTVGVIGFASMSAAANFKAHRTRHLIIVMGAIFQAAYLIFHFISAYRTGHIAAPYIWVFSMSGSVFYFLLADEITAASKNPTFTSLTPLFLIANFTVPLFLAALFAQTVYPEISPAWGGGSPTRVVLTFGKDSPLSGQKLQKLLIDETNSAFYVVDAPNGQAHYVPKSSIQIVDYEVDPPEKD